MPHPLGAEPGVASGPRMRPPLLTPQRLGQASSWSGLFLCSFQGGFTVCSEMSSGAQACCSWPGLPQPSPPACGTFPTGGCWPAKITDLVWFLHGFLGAGLLVRMRFTYLTSSRRKMFLNNLQITEQFISSWGPRPGPPGMADCPPLCPQHRRHKRPCYWLILLQMSLYAPASHFRCELLKNTAQVSFTFASKAAVPLLGIKGWFCRRQFFHRLGTSKGMVWG